MFALLFSLLTRFSFTQVVALVATASVATVAVAGSADVVSMVDALTRVTSGSRAVTTASRTTSSRRPTRIWSVARCCTSPVSAVSSARSRRRAA